MFNLGLPEFLVIGAAVLLLFGPKRLPELLKGLGKGIRDFKRALDGVEEESREALTRSQNVSVIAPELEPSKRMEPTVTEPSPAKS